ncbi:AMP-binding protein [Xanthobacter sp. TB0139]|uniref:AMP-binding protein n=1 Tax=Xanthobacter sp. TB0139 TaxID=3459178 RepID=UPI00403A3447
MTDMQTVTIPATLPDALSLHATQRPDDAFLISPATSGEAERILTFGACAQQMEHHARALVSLGVRSGDRVAVRLPKSPEAILLFLAITRTGATYVPINPDFTPREAQVLIEDSQPVLVIDNDEAARSALAQQNIKAMAFGTGTADDIATLEADDPLPQIGADDRAVMLFTSGTTGRPKGAPLTHANLLTNVASLASAWGFTQADRLLHVLPVFHGHGLFLGVTMPVLVGASVILLPKFDAAETIRLLPQASVFMAVPAIYTRLLDRPEFTTEACRTLRLSTSGSAALSPELFRELQQRMGLSVVERYGLTETCILTSNPIDGSARVGSVGRPLSCVELQIAGENDEPLPTNSVGRVLVRGGSIIDHYWQRPDRGKDWTANGWFRTGDMGRIDDDGFVWLVGREKDLIITGGYNVYPREVEIQIETQPGVAEAVVFGVPHPDFGEGVMAAIKPEPGATLDLAGIEEGIAAGLSKYKRPKRLVVVEEFPRNAMGKVLKTELRRIHADTFAKKDS